MARTEPTPTWRIARSKEPSFDYVPSELTVYGPAALDRAREVARDAEVLEEAGNWFRLRGVPDTLSTVELLRAEGFVAQPNHVFWASGCGPSCPPHPAYAQAALHAVGQPYSGTPYSGTPYSGTPYSGTPYSGTPYSGTPYSGTPYSGTPYSGTPYSGTKPPMSTARPAEEPLAKPRKLMGDGAHPKIRILDSGLADPRPDSLASQATGGGSKITGDNDSPDDPVKGADGVTTAPDNYLDPIAGHGTFIAGLIEMLAPGCEIHVRRILEPLGDVSEADLAAAIRAAVDGKDGASAPDIIGLSLGGPVMESPFQLRAAIAYARAQGILVVASAGNSGTCVKNYPAALASVIAVGALGPEGPAPWSNYGDWLDACAPGTGLVSAFFRSFNGAMPEINSVDPDHFEGWAQWSGTSFAAPVVIAALAREMVAGNCDADEAEQRILRAPHLYRIPCFGTVVNL